MSESVEKLAKRLRKNIEAGENPGDKDIALFALEVGLALIRLGKRA